MGVTWLRGPVAKGQPLHLSWQQSKCADSFAWNSFLSKSKHISEPETVHLRYFKCSMHINNLNKMTTYNLNCEMNPQRIHPTL